MSKKHQAGKKKEVQSPVAKPAQASKVAPVPAKGISGFFNSILLFFAACICITIVLSLNKPWFERVKAYWSDYLVQKNEMDIETRKVNRYGNSYLISKSVSDYLEQQKEKEKAIVLMPPADYFREKQIDYAVPEPAVFYYYTGLKTVWHSTRDTASINWVVYIDNGTLAITKITDTTQRNQWLQTFRKYKLPL